MTQRYGHTTQDTFSKKDHKIALKKRLEKAKKAVKGADNKQLFCDDNSIKEQKTTSLATHDNTPIDTTSIRKLEGRTSAVQEKGQDGEYTRKNKPNPFTHAQQKATHYSTQRQLLFDRMQQERLEKDKAIKEKKGKRERDKRIHLSRTRKGQPRLGGMLEGLLGKIEKQLHQ